MQILKNLNGKLCGGQEMLCGSCIVLVEYGHWFRITHIKPHGSCLPLLYRRSKMKACTFQTGAILKGRIAQPLRKQFFHLVRCKNSALYVDRVATIAWSKVRSEHKEEPC